MSRLALVVMTLVVAACSSNDTQGHSGYVRSAPPPVSAPAPAPASVSASAVDDGTYAVVVDEPGDAAGGTTFECADSSHSSPRKQTGMTLSECRRRVRAHQRNNPGHYPDCY